MGVAYLSLHDRREDFHLPEDVLIRRHPCVPPGEALVFPEGADPISPSVLYEADPVTIGLWLNHGPVAMRGTT